MSSDPPGSILAVTAHPDDAELWMGGTLAWHARHATVTIAVERVDERRAVEATLGAEILGSHLELVDRHEERSCVDLLRRLKPEVLIVHPRNDMHHDHRRVAEIALAAVPLAIIETGFPRRVYECDTYESLTLDGPFYGQVVVDVTETFETKIQALQAHQSQPSEHFVGMAERMGATWGGRIGKPRAEAFQPVPVLGRLPGATCL
ncbi:MAG: PIG-L deacetylase family protein [Pseudonocardiaceae bacterium]